MTKLKQLIKDQACILAEVLVFLAIFHVIMSSERATTLLSFVAILAIRNFSYYVMKQELWVAAYFTKDKPNE